MATKTPLSLNCLAIIGRLKQKNFGKRFFKKKKFRIKAILYAHKQKFLDFKEDHSKRVIFHVEKETTLPGRIVKMEYDKNLHSLIGTVYSSPSWALTAKCLLRNYQKSECD